jgi:hypothetical protein
LLAVIKFSSPWECPKVPVVNNNAFIMRCFKVKVLEVVKMLSRKVLF